MTVARVTAPAALVAFIVAAAILAATAPASPLAKAFPQGCWEGKGVFSGTYSTANLNAKVSNGKLAFTLWVDKAKKVYGALELESIGTGSLRISGSELAMQVNMTGDLDLSGKSDAVVASGTWRWKGSAIGTGQFAGAGQIPVDIKLPLKGPLTVVTVSKLKLTGLFRSSKWTAVKFATKETKAACS
jgi:hypothetical protein